MTRRSTYPDLLGLADKSQTSSARMIPWTMHPPTDTRPHELALAAASSGVLRRSVVRLAFDTPCTFGIRLTRVVSSYARRGSLKAASKSPDRQPHMVERRPPGAVLRSARAEDRGWHWRPDRPLCLGRSSGRARRRIPPRYPAAQTFIRLLGLRAGADDLRCTRWWIPGWYGGATDRSARRVSHAGSVDGLIETPSRLGKRVFARAGSVVSLPFANAPDARTYRLR